MASPAKSGWKRATSKIALISTAAAKVKERRDEVNRKFAEISKDMEERGKQLRAALENAQFNEKAERVEVAIAELMREATDESFLSESQGGNFERKIKAHKEFEDDVGAQDGVKQDLVLAADALIKAGHYAADVIQKRKDAILAQWEVLQAKSQLKKERLQECHAKALFLRDADDTLAWLDSNRAIATQTDVGEDLDSAKTVQRNFDEFKATLRANEQSRVTRVVDTALGLIAEAHPESESIDAKRKAIVAAWGDLQKQVHERDAALDNALVMHEYTRDVDEVLSRIAAKAALLSGDSTTPVPGSTSVEGGEEDDLRSVEDQRRTHEALVIQTKSLEDEVARLADEAREMLTDATAGGPSAHVVSAATLTEKQKMLTDAWEALCAQAKARGAVLDASFEEKKFISNVRAYATWSDKIREQMLAEDPQAVTDVAGAALLLQRHEENRAKIEAEFGRMAGAPTHSRSNSDVSLLSRTSTSTSGHEKANKKFEDLVCQGEFLVVQGHSGLATHVQSLQETKAAIEALWVKRQLEFRERRDFLLFVRNVDRVNVWIAKQQAAVATTDLGDSLGTVDKLLRKHDNFQKSLTAQQAKMDELQAQCDALKASGHSQASEIASQLEACQAVRAALVQRAAERQDQLAASERYQQFLRDAKEVEDWVAEKSKASDDNYTMSSSLRAKLQWHENFQAELDTNASRVVEVRATAARLVGDGHYAAAQIEARLADVNAVWDALMGGATDKEKMLTEAGKVQLLRMKATDMEHWCDATAHKLQSTDYGDSLQRIDNLLKAHVLLDADVVGYDTRVQAVQAEGRQIIADGNHLAAEVEAMLAAMVARYEALGPPKQHRQHMLELSQALHQFYRNVDVEIKWSHAKINDMAAADIGNSVAAVQRQQKKHINLDSEVATRETAVATVLGTAASLAGTEGYTDAQRATITEKQEELTAAWTAVHARANARRSALAAALEMQQYLADAAETHALLEKKLVVVGSTDYGTGEGSVSLLTKHNNEVHNLKTYRATVDELAERSRRCTGATSTVSASAPGTTAGLGTVTVKYAYPTAGREKKAKELAITKGEVLVLLKNTDKDWWKVQRGADKGYVPANYVVRNPAPSSTESDPAPSDPNGHAPNPAVVAMQQTIEDVYATCLREAEKRSRLLDEAIKMYKLKTHRDTVDLWITECEEAVSVLMPGTDIDHNELLQKQFDNFRADLTSNETRLEEVRSLGQAFIANGHSQSAAIQESLDALNARWAELFQLAEAKQAFLAAAHDMHRFHRDVDEVTARVAEMATAVGTDDVGKDLSTVEALQRKHDALARDLRGALAAKVDKLVGDATALQTAQPLHAAEVEGKCATVQDSWQSLKAAADDRKLKLDEARSYQLFLKDFRDLSSWVGGVHEQAKSTEVASDQTTADDMLKQHQELQHEFNTRLRDVDGLKAAGDVLITQLLGTYAGETQTLLADLDAELEQLGRDMEARNVKLQQCCELQKFTRGADQVDMWISTQETPLLSTDYGASLGAVESLLKKHGDFEKAFVAQTEQIDEVCAEADRLVADQHYDAPAITARKQALREQWEKLTASASDRKDKLFGAQRLHQFLRDTDEMETWMNEKLHVAGDPSFQDPTNLQGKAQKHSKFNAEVGANQERVFNVIHDGEKLVSENPENVSLIEERNATLRHLWDDLGKQSANKGQKLEEARQQQQYNLSVEDVEFWLSQVERLASNDDLGSDLLSVKSLVKKHGIIVNDIREHQPAITKVEAQAQAFVAANHFDAAGIAARCASIVDRYAKVNTVASERTFALNESLKLQHLLRDVDDEALWVRGRQRVATSTDYGRDLTSVQSLVKKHGATLDEIHAHAGIVRDVLAAADALVQSNHYDLESIQRSRDDLAALWQDLETQAAERGKLLAEEVTHREFVAKASEEVSWIGDKLHLLEQRVTTDTLSSAEALVRKHEAFDVDCAEHQTRVAALSATAKALVASNNRAADDINAHAADAVTQMDTLVRVAAERKQRLDSLIGYLHFTRDADNIEAWIADKAGQASASDYSGRGLAVVEELITKHDAFHAAIVAFKTKRMAPFDVMHTKLIQAKNSEAELIVARHKSVTSSWTKLQTDSEARTVALNKELNKCKEIEALLLEFAQKASEFNMWFENAEEDLSDPVHNQLNSLEEIQFEKTKFTEFMQSYKVEKSKFNDIITLDAQINRLHGGSEPIKNPYTWFTVDALSGFWQTLDAVIEDRENDLALEQTRQEKNEALRLLFAKQANAFARFINDTRSKMTEGSGSLEAQLHETKAHHAATVAKRVALEEIERTGAEMENLLILDNKHTEHTTVQLAQLWDQLEQLGTRMKYSLEQQIEQKNASGVSDERLQEIEEIFRAFDADGSGSLERPEIKACVRALGMNLPVVDEGEADPEFEGIMASMDPDGNGVVSMTEFKSYMITRETTNVESSEEVVKAFAQAANGKPYITKGELQASLSAEQADHCIRNMRPYVDDKGIEVGGGYDYASFVNILFTAT
eukprot:m.1437305 g.1437305  ORF g.1437305 m.1437305 type:complete len:2502 (+) comp25086_c0_seq1:132-7637(+)